MNTGTKGMAIFEVLIAMLFFSLLLNGIYRHAFGEKGIMSTQEALEERTELTQYRMLLCKRTMAEMNCDMDNCTAIQIFPSQSGKFTAVYAEGYPSFDTSNGIVRSSFIIKMEGKNVEQVDCRY